MPDRIPVNPDWSPLAQIGYCPSCQAWVECVVFLGSWLDGDPMEVCCGCHREAMQTSGPAKGKPRK